MTRLFSEWQFKSAVRIPADLAYERQDIALEIEREGDEIKIGLLEGDYPAC